MVVPGCNEKKKYIYNTITEKIREMIINGELSQGDRLPPERKLAEIFRVSRNSVRQAVQTLAERGILESRQGDGTYVCAAPDSSFIFEGFAESLIERNAHILEIIEFRQLIEPVIASLAAGRIARDEIERLRIIVCDQQVRLVTEMDDSDLDSEFHLALAEFSGNRVIFQVMGTINSILNESRSDYLQSSERRKGSVDGHLKIIEALESGNSERASISMKEHLDAVEHHIFGLKS